jgi:hypothetical protein
MTQAGGDIAVDQPTAQQTYTSAQETLRDHHDGIPHPDDHGLEDPTISKALRDHNDKTKGNIDAAGDSLGTGKDAADGLADTDADSAARTNRGGGPGGVSALRDALARDSGPASLFAAPEAAMPMPAPAPAMSAPAMPPMSVPQMLAMPAAPASFVLPPQALARLLANAAPTGGAAAGARAGGETGGRQPLRDSQIAFHPTGQTLTRPQVNALIDRCLDNNGVTTDPKVRALWHDILSNQWFHESSFDPNAINRDAGNSGPLRGDGGAGDAARGIAQTKPGTFAAYHVGGTSNNIFDPEANGSAGVAYMLAEYHVSADGTGLEAFHARRVAAGYGAY